MQANIKRGIVPNISLRLDHQSFHTEVPITKRNIFIIDY